MANVLCEKCNHKWNYKGKSKLYITCPHCYRKIKKSKAIKNHKVFK